MGGKIWELKPPLLCTDPPEPALLCHAAAGPGGHGEGTAGRALGAPGTERGPVGAWGTRGVGGLSGKRGAEPSLLKGRMCRGVTGECGSSLLTGDRSHSPGGSREPPFQGQGLTRPDTGP